MARACTLTYAAAQCLPQALPVWWRLFALLKASEAVLPDRSEAHARRREVAEHLLAHAAPEHVDADFLCDVAALYAHDDPARSHGLFARAAEQQPLGEAACRLWQDVAWQAGAYAHFVALAADEDARDGAADGDPRTLRRRLRLAVACARTADGAAASEGWLSKVLAEAEGVLGGRMPPRDIGLWREVADLCATRPANRAEALALYVEILHHQPVNVDVLRLAARLCGGSGDVERAYGFYACLLWLLPSDEEAGRFVDACRARAARQAEVQRGRGQGRPLVKKVQLALDEVAAAASLPEDSRPTRAYDVAQLVRRDIDEVLREMVPQVHGTPRASALRTYPDALTLFRFAQTPAYFALRERLVDGPDAELERTPERARHTHVS